MIIDFNEKDHCYSVNGEIASISVTELLAKHGLAPNYSGVKQETLSANAEQGKIVHKDLENILNKKKYKPTTKQGENFEKWVKENLDCGVGEQMLAYDYKGMVFVGTADVMGLLKDGTYFVGDHKNTSQFHREYVSWQVSLLDYFARQLGEERVNEKKLNWKGAQKFFCFHYNKETGDMTVYELEKIPDEEIVKLLEAEFTGELYKRPILVIDKELQENFEKAELAMIDIESSYNLAKANSDNLRGQLCQMMEEQGIKSWTTQDGLITVTYICASEQDRVDSKKLKTKYPMIYGECAKTIKKKAYVMITNRAKDI